MRLNTSESPSRYLRYYNRVFHMGNEPPDQQKTPVAPKLPFPGGLPLHDMPAVRAKARNTNRLRQKLDELDRIQPINVPLDQASKSLREIVQMLPVLARSAFVDLGKEIASEVRKTGIAFIAKVIICGAVAVAGGTALWLWPAQPASPPINKIQPKTPKSLDANSWQKGTTVNSAPTKSIPK